MDIFKIEIKDIIIILSLILFSAWTIRLSHKFFDKKTKRYVLAIGGRLVFWIMARLVVCITMHISSGIFIMFL